VIRKPSGPKGRMKKGPQVTRKPSGPTGRMEMEKGPTSTRVTQVVGSHRSDGDGFHRYTSDGRMEKGSGIDFYDKLLMSWMNNCRSHMYTSDEERTVWRFMTKCRSLQIEYCSS
jgi:gluconate kinase